jgi:hypothetical protein
MIFWFNSIIPKILNVEAITLWPFVFLRGDSQSSWDAHVVQHELVHCSQIKQLGVFKFYYNYLREWLRNGRQYEAIHAEIEAYALQDFTYSKYFSTKFNVDKKFVCVKVEAELNGLRDGA